MLQIDWRFSKFQIHNFNAWFDSYSDVSLLTASTREAESERKRALTSMRQSEISVSAGRRSSVALQLWRCLECSGLDPLNDWASGQFKTMNFRCSHGCVDCSVDSDTSGSRLNCASIWSIIHCLRFGFLRISINLMHNSWCCRDFGVIPESRHLSTKKPSRCYKFEQISGFTYFYAKDDPYGNI